MTISKLLLFIVILFICLPSFCQQQNSFRRLGVNDGLSQNSVREIFQDRQGFMWIGTGDGLNRYDGKQIKKYRESFRDKSAKRLPGKIINGKIIQDDHQNLWMIVDGKVVKMHLPTETFSIIKRVGRDLDCRILGIQQNEIFVVTPRGIVSINALDYSHRIIDLESVFGLYLPNKEDAGLLYMQQNSIYLFDVKTKHRSLLINTGKQQLLHPNMCDNTTLVFVSGERVHEFDLKQRNITASYAIPDELINKGWFPVPNTKLPDGRIVANLVNNGFIIIDNITGTFTNYTNMENDPFSLSSNLLYTAIVDHSNNLWLGTEGGGINILNLKPRLFDAFPLHAIANKESSLLMVKAIYHTKGSIFIGTYSKGLVKVNRFNNTYETLFEPVKIKDTGFHGIFFIKEDDEKRIWMNKGSRIGIVDLEKGTFINSIDIGYNRKGRTHNIPQCFGQIAPDRFILGTFHSTYLIQYQNGHIKATDLGIINKNLEDDIQSVYTKDNGDIIIGKGEGKGYITLRINNTTQPLIVENGLSKLTVKHIYRDDRRKAFWYATNVGIVIQSDNHKNLQVIDEQDGLSNDFVYAIIKEDDYSFWVSTNKGLNKIKLAKSNSIKVRSIEQYGLQHGLQSNEFNTGAYFKDNHQVFFGGVTGINWFDERKFVKRTFIPRSYITNILINEKSLTTDTCSNFLKRIQLQYDENNIFIRFATLDYTNPDVNQYQYRLKGYDAEWINAASLPEARYSKLAHGDYLFEIKAANSDGIWSAPQQLLRITILPPFWLTWWFKILALASLAAIIFFSARYYLKRKLEKQLQIIEKKLAINNERLRISRDMHDELGTGLSKIALLSEVGKKSKAPNEEIINEISATSRGLAHKMGEIIWTLNPHNDTLGNLVAYLKEYVYDTTENLPVQINFDLPDDIPDVTLSHLYRQQLLLVTKEALNNALKYAQATQISFGLSVTGSLILFTIEDNGVGFDVTQIPKQKAGKRNGLENMRARIESIGGFYELTTGKEPGTKVTYGFCK
jgi:signal transduction histidine kinase